MEVQKLKISEPDRKLVSVFMDEEYPLEIDFNWLMPVVEKIKISDEWGWEHPTTLLHYDLHHSLINLDLKSLWLAVVDFINWYNQTQNK